MSVLSSLLVQHYYSGMMSQPASGLSTVDMTIRLPNQTLAGNCLALWVSYQAGSAITSVTDENSTWPAAALTVTSGADNRLSLFILPNTPAGSRAIRIQFDVATNGFASAVSEWCGIATTSPVVQTKSSTTATSASIATAAMSPAPVSGNLVLQFGIINEGAPGAQNAGIHDVTAFTRGTSFVLLGGSMNNFATENPYMLQGRFGDGNAMTPAFTATQGVNDTWNTIAVELTTSAGAGTPMPTDKIRIRKEQYGVGPAAASTNWVHPFPHECGAIAADVPGAIGMVTIQDGTNTLCTDSESNTWRHAQAAAGLPKGQYVKPGQSGNDAYTVTTRSDSNPNCTYNFVELFKASGEIGAVTTNTGTTTATDTFIPHAPDITPLLTTGRSMIVVSVPIGHGPLTALVSPTPASALFMPVFYPEETDFDTMNNADGYGHLLVTDRTTVEFRWEWNVLIAVPSIESWQALAVEFLEQPDNTVVRLKRSRNRPAMFAPGLAR